MYVFIGQAGYLAGYYVWDKLDIWLDTMYKTGWIFGWILCTGQAGYLAGYYL